MYWPSTGVKKSLQFSVSLDSTRWNFWAHVKSKTLPCAWEAQHCKYSQQEENPQLHILVQCHHLSDTVINNVFEYFRSVLHAWEVGHMESSPGVSILKWIPMTRSPLLLGSPPRMATLQEFPQSIYRLPLLEGEKVRWKQISFFEVYVTWKIINFSRWFWHL